MAEQMRKVVIVDGCRIPFLRSGTGYRQLMAYELGRLAVKGLLHKTQLDINTIDYLTMGIVIAEITTSNVAREVALAVGLPDRVAAHTVTMACISANQAITGAYDLIRTGQIDVAIAGGIDTISDFPVRYRREFRQKLLAARNYKTVLQFAKFLLGLRLRHLLPEMLNITEFSTGLSMGQNCERMVARFGITREQQDQYALRSHQLAAKATEDGLLGEEIYPVRVPPKFATIARDNGIRPDSSMDKLQKLKPAFDRRFGSVTAGNSSFLTDGASAVLLMAEDVAKSMGYQGKARINNYVYTAHNPQEELLLGPAFATPQVLDKAGLKIGDIDVFEYHEAFAGQILTVLKCLDSNNFACEHLGRSEKVGAIPMDKLNTLGGSLSLGHPFGATGARLVTTATNRLLREDGQFALTSSCAGGAMASAIILERCA